MGTSLNTPILFLVFNRPTHTQQVFEVIKAVQPPKLYIASDGPRLDKAGEKETVEQIRNHILKNVTWNCEIKTLFREENLGCKYGVSRAIDWFFQHEEMGIILEDDCLPSQSFFQFCEALLNKYKYDTRVGHIGGTNPIFQQAHSNSYYFSKYNRIWGWATWRRAWQFYDVEIEFWPKMKEQIKLLLGKEDWKIYKNILEKIYLKKIDTWDYQWFICRLLTGSKSIIPNTNLVSNIGFSKEATHTKNENSSLSKLPLGDFIFPIQHPNHNFIIEDYKKDKKWNNYLKREQSILNKILLKL